MKIETFRENLEVYGSDISRWPEKIREAGEQLVIHSDEARKLQREMSRVDGLFRIDKTSKPPQDLVDRIVKKAEELD